MVLVRPAMASPPPPTTHAPHSTQWLHNEPFDNTDGHMTVCPHTGGAVPKRKGQWTLKRYLLASKVRGQVSLLTSRRAWAHGHLLTCLRACADKRQCVLERQPEADGQRLAYSTADRPP